MKFFINDIVKSCQRICAARGAPVLREDFTDCCVLTRKFYINYSSGRFGISGGAGGGLVSGSCSGMVSGVLRGHTGGSGSLRGFISGSFPGMGTSAGLPAAFTGGTVYCDDAVVFIRLVV